MSLRWIQVPYVHTSFIKIGSGIESLTGREIHRNTDSMEFFCLFKINMPKHLRRYDNQSSEDGSRTHSRNMVIH
jgi:hypothetical protein